MKKEVHRTQIYSEAIEEVLFFFRDHTWELLDRLDCLWDSETTGGISAKQIEERIELLVGLTKEQTGITTIKQFLSDYGFSPAKIRRFSRECGKADLKRQADFPDISIPVERLLALFLQDRLAFLELVLHDSEEDPHYSAVTSDWLLKDYLICKSLDQKYSVREFLRTQGYSIADIDLFYEKYRKECLHCYSREPKKPQYANGILKVYEVEGIYVVAVLAEKENRVIDPRGAEFTTDRQVKWTKKLDLVELPESRTFLGKTAKELRAELGEPHIFLAFGEKENVPSYITEQGHLIGFVLVHGKIADFEELDLLRQSVSVNKR